MFTLEEDKKKKLKEAAKERLEKLKKLAASGWECYYRFKLLCNTKGNKNERD